MSGEICSRCHGKAVLDKDWEPPTGYNQRLRRYVCPRGHENFIQLSPSMVEQLKSLKLNATCERCGRIKREEVRRNSGQGLCVECRKRKG